MNFRYNLIFLSNRKVDVLVISLGELVKGKGYFGKLEISEILKIDSFKFFSSLTSKSLLTYNICQQKSLITYKVILINNT